jgi:hypothetical protein
MQMVSGDLAPSVQATLQNSDGSAVTLTGCTVMFRLSQGGQLLFSKAATIVDATNGIVEYNWQAGDTNVVGQCKADFLVTFPGGATQTFPTEEDFIITFLQPVTAAPPVGGLITDSDVIAQLNISGPDDNNNYTVYGLTVTEETLEAHTAYANNYINGLLPNLETTDQRYSLAKLAAINIASLRVLVVASGGSLGGAYDYFLGDLRVTRAAPYAAAITRTLEGLKTDLLKMITNLSTPVMTGNVQYGAQTPTYRGGLASP